MNVIPKLMKKNTSLWRNEHFVIGLYYTNFFFILYLHITNIAYLYRGMWHSWHNFFNYFDFIFCDFFLCPCRAHTSCITCVSCDTKIWDSWFLPSFARVSSTRSPTTSHISEISYEDLLHIFVHFGFSKFLGSKSLT